MGLDALFPSMQPDTPAPEPVAETLITSAPVQPATTAAEAMYPSMPDATEPEQPEAQPADVNPLESHTPEEVKALRDADPTRRLYSAQETYKGELSAEVFDSVEGEGITPEVRQQAAATWREIAADIELSPVEVRELIPVFQAPPPTPDQQASNRAVAMQWLVDQYGDGAGAALEAAQSLVARDPRVAALLEHSGAGDDPRVVKKVVAVALKQVRAGKLKIGQKK
jgi:hypothetical protein